MRLQTPVEQPPGPQGSQGRASLGAQGAQLGEAEAQCPSHVGPPCPPGLPPPGKAMPAVAETRSRAPRPPAWDLELVTCSKPCNYPMRSTNHSALHLCMCESIKWININISNKAQRASLLQHFRLFTGRLMYEIRPGLLWCPEGPEGDEVGCGSCASSVTHQSDKNGHWQGGQGALHRAGGGAKQHRLFGVRMGTGQAPAAAVCTV